MIQIALLHSLHYSVLAVIRIVTVTHMILRRMVLNSIENLCHSWLLLQRLLIRVGRLNLFNILCWLLGLEYLD